MSEGLARRKALGISPEVPDWSREAKGRFEWQPGKALLASIRSYQRHAARRGPAARVLRAWAVIRHRFWSAVSGADIPVTCRIGGGLRMPHPAGIVIHPQAVIGVNCQIMQHVTVGVGGKPGLPQIGGHVDLGAGACVLGPVEIGNHAVVGAMALVIKDMPPGAVALGPLATLRTD